MLELRRALAAAESAAAPNRSLAADLREEAATSAVRAQRAQTPLHVTPPSKARECEFRQSRLLTVFLSRGVYNNY